MSRPKKEPPLTPRNITLSLNPDLKRRIVEGAKRSNMSQAAYCQATLDYFVTDPPPIFETVVVPLGEFLKNKAG